MALAKAISINLYAANARARTGIIPYAGLFESIVSQDVAQTVREISREFSFAVDLDEQPQDSGAQRVFAGHVIAGSPDSVPLFFDYKTGVTEEGETPAGKWLAQKTRIVISVSQDYRYIALEGTRNGVTPTRLAQFFGLLAESNLQLVNVEFDIIPVQSDSLLDEIASFERITQATAIVTRPNQDWTDMRDQLLALAEESVGHEVEATVKAAKGETLSRSHGIVGTIVNGLSSKTPALRRFRIAGRKPNADRDTVVTSERHQQRAFARPARSATTAEVDELVYSDAKALIDSQLPNSSENKSDNSPIAHGSSETNA